MLAGDPPWITSRSVAQIATASMRTRTSARPGTGVSLSRKRSSSGLPKTQAFIWSGTGNCSDVLTPAGSYIEMVLVCRKTYMKLLEDENPRYRLGRLNQTVRPKAYRFRAHRHPHPARIRSEEHTSELQSHVNLV